MLKPGPHFRFGLMVGILILVADQISKWWVLGPLDLPAKQSIELLPALNFTMVWNYGISMGLPVGEQLGRWGIVALTAGISLWLLRWLGQTTRRFEALALGLIVGGAVGNIIDRFIHGAVADFIHLHAMGYSFYVFNVADSAITIGVVLLLIDGLRHSDKGPKNAQKADQHSVGKGESS